MTEFTQDKIFKNVAEEDAQILLKILGKDSKKVKVWTKELRLLDPKDYRPDLIVELDDENLIVELQSTYVNEEFSKRALTFVAIGNRDKINNKEVNLIVLSSKESTKTINYRYNRQNVFTYDVVGMKDFDVAEIINNVEPKIDTNKKILGYDLVLYSLLPLIDSNNIDKHAERVSKNLIKLENLSESIQALSFGIEWLIVDKYVADKEKRNILCDLLGDKMSLIDEYGERREQKGMEKGIEKGIEKEIKRIIKKLYSSGMEISEIASRLEIDVTTVKKIVNSN